MVLQLQEQLLFQYFLLALEVANLLVSRFCKNKKRIRRYLLIFIMVVGSLLVSLEEYYYFSLKTIFCFIYFFSTGFQLPYGSTLGAGPNIGPGYSSTFGSSTFLNFFIFSLAAQARTSSLASFCWFSCNLASISVIFCCSSKLIYPSLGASQLDSKRKNFQLHAFGKKLTINYRI